MEKQSFRNILALITVTVAIILGTQIYRTLENYKVNKQRFINDVQLALDLSVENYYADKARSDIFIMLSNRDSLTVTSLNSVLDHPRTAYFDSLVRNNRTLQRDTVNTNGFIYAWSKGTRSDSMINSDSRDFSFKIDSLLAAGKSARIKDLKKDQSSQSFLQLSQKVMVSLSEDLLELGKMNSLLSEELERKNLDLNYKLEHDGFSGTTAIGAVKEDFELSTLAKSTYLPAGQSLKLSFDNESLLILKKGIVDIILSLAIVSIVIGALLYLYRVIFQQKQIAAIKDDLISNITHEFKTPIATITSAIEGLSYFNENNDKEKTKRYLTISSDQLGKLNMMVEKLLETAAIDSGEIQIDRQETDVTALTSKIVANYKLIAEQKGIELTLPEKPVFWNLDEFHLENAVSNLIDNAIKYGGNHIKVVVDQHNDHVSWKVIDDGGCIKKEDRTRIFEKLYRVPTGNQHDVKGFGIGLYYTKAIVEKHGGRVELDVREKYTCFTITL